MAESPSAPRQAHARVDEAAIAARVDLLTSARRAAALRTRFAAGYGVDLPRVGRSVRAGEFIVLARSPDHWRCEFDGPIGDGSAVSHAAAALCAAVGDDAAVVDQSDGWRSFDVVGPGAREVLAKGVPIDLDATVFPVGDVARTLVAHVAVTLRCVSAEPVFRLSVARSYAGSLLDWLRDAGAEENPQRALRDRHSASPR